MQKILLTLFLFLICSYPSIADQMMSLPDTVNSHIFSTDATKPLMNLERTQYTNKAIMQIEDKQKPKKENSADSKKENEPMVKEKTKFKDLFKGFVIEY